MKLNMRSKIWANIKAWFYNHNPRNKKKGLRMMVARIEDSNRYDTFIYRTVEYTLLSTDTMNRNRRVYDIDPKEAKRIYGEFSNSIRRYTPEIRYCSREDMEDNNS